MSDHRQIPDVPMSDWQTIRFGDDDAARMAVAYYRERDWPVDSKNMPDEVETRIYSFISGFNAARGFIK
jgi:hypothetical protein